MNLFTIITMSLGHDNYLAVHHHKYIMSIMIKPQPFHAHTPVHARIHTHTRARTYTHAHARARARTHARTRSRAHARTHTGAGAGARTRTQQTWYSTTFGRLTRGPPAPSGPTSRPLLPRREGGCLHRALARGLRRMAESAAAAAAGRGCTCSGDMETAVSRCI